MNYAEAINYIDNKSRLGIEPGLANITELLGRLGNPQDDVKCIHIAGTNGKGSVFAFVQEAFIQAGFCVGRYISPSVFGYLEKFQLDRRWMSENEFCEILEEVAEVTETMVREGLHSPTAFEIETAVAYLYFKRKKVDIALIECGMGGRLDATNVLNNPAMCVFAPIGMDHMQFLGDSLTQIAKEKAGIIKNNVVCVSAVQTGEVTAVLEEVCREKGSELFTVKDIEQIETETEQSSFVYEGEKYFIRLIGPHQVENACLALEVLKVLGDRYPELYVSRECIKDALYSTEWLGRMSKLSDNPLVYADGAHNVHAWKALDKSLKKYFTNKRIIFIIGVLKDKDYETMLDILEPHIFKAVTITPPGPRALPAEVLTDCMKSRGIDVYTATHIKNAGEMAAEMAGENDVIMICGSLSFLAEFINEQNRTDITK